VLQALPGIVPIPLPNSRGQHARRHPESMAEVGGRGSGRISRGPTRGPYRDRPAPRQQPRHVGPEGPPPSPESTWRSTPRKRETGQSRVCEGTRVGTIKGRRSVRLPFGPDDPQETTIGGGSWRPPAMTSWPSRGTPKDSGVATAWPACLISTGGMIGVRWTDAKPRRWPPRSSAPRNPNASSPGEASNGRGARTETSRPFTVGCRTVHRQFACPVTTGARKLGLPGRCGELPSGTAAGFLGGVDASASRSGPACRPRVRARPPVSATECYDP